MHFDLVHRSGCAPRPENIGKQVVVGWVPAGVSTHPDFEAVVDVIEWILSLLAMSRSSWMVLDSGLW